MSDIAAVDPPKGLRIVQISAVSGMMTWALMDDGSVWSLAGIAWTKRVNAPTWKDWLFPVQKELIRQGGARGEAVMAEQDTKRGEIVIDLLASLVAAVSLLKRGSKKAAPSDKMFDQMIIDYERSIERGRAFLNSERSE